MGKRLFVLVSFAWLLCACGGSSQQNAELRSVVLTQPASLGTTAVKNYSGVVKEAHTINLGFKTAGQLESISVKEGDYVRKGQELAKLDDADYKLGVEALQIQYDQLSDEVKRTRKLYEQKSVSANDYEKAVAGLNQLGVQLQTYKNKLEYTVLYAPTAGYIQSVNFSVAEMVDTGTPVFTFMDVSRMEVAADIPASEYLKHDKFTSFYCKAAGIDQTYPLVLSSIVPRADGNQLYEMRFAFASQPDSRLTSGINVEVSIVKEDADAQPALSVPLCSVFYEGEDAYVWVYNDGTVSKRKVTLGNLNSEGRASVTAGLSQDEKIVRAGVNVLTDGEQVKVIDRDSKTNVGGLL